MAELIAAYARGFYRFHQAPTSRCRDIFGMRIRLPPACVTSLKMACAIVVIPKRGLCLYDSAALLISKEGFLLTLAVPPHPQAGKFYSNKTPGPACGYRATQVKSHGGAIVSGIRCVPTTLGSLDGPKSFLGSRYIPRIPPHAKHRDPNVSPLLLLSVSISPRICPLPPPSTVLYAMR